MPPLISVTYQYLLDHYGPLLTMKHLAEVLHTSYGGLRMDIVRGNHPLAVGLASAQRRVGRRIYFDSGQVAALLDGVPAPVIVDSAAGKGVSRLSR